MSTPKTNTAYEFTIALLDTAVAGAFKASPTLAAGDFKVSIDNGAYNNLSSLPTIAPAGSINVRIQLTDAEMNGTKITVQAIDAADDEWDDALIFIDATATTINEIVRSTTPANTLDVNANGNVGIDFGNIDGILTKDFVSWVDDSEHVGLNFVDTSGVLGNDSVSWIDSNDRTNVGRWIDTAVTLSSTTSKPEMDMFSISDEALPANNLQLQYNTSGLIGSTFPSFQDQLDNFAAGGGAPNAVAESRTLTTGLETNTFADTQTLDGITHDIADDGGVIDFYYQFDVTSTGTPTSIIWTGFAQSNGDSYNVFGWNWSGTSWDQIGTIDGKNGTNTVEKIFLMTTAHVGTGGDEGKVRFRIQSTTGTEIFTDRILCSFASALTVGEITSDLDANSLQLIAISGDAHELLIDWRNGGRLDLILDNVLADTNELQTDWANAGRLDTILDSILSDTNELQTDNIPTLISALNNISTAQVNAEADQALSDFFTSSAQLVDDVWDEVLTGATHNVATSAGRRLRQIEAAFVLHTGTAQAGTSNTIQLDTGANANDDFYNHSRVIITENTGVEQERIIVDYDGATKIATIAPPWVTNPASGSEFEIEPAISHAETNSKTVTVGLAQSGTSNTIKLASTESSITDFYKNDVVSIDSGTGEGQERIITAYNSTTKVATVEPDWNINPDTTSEYVIEEALVVADIFAISNDVTAANNLELDYDGTGYNKSASTIGTTTLNTDMRGTNSAALASVCTELRLAELDAANLPTNIDAIETDTNELQTDWKNTGRLDTILDSILADTNELQTDNIPSLINGLNDISISGIWDELTSGHTRVGGFAVAITDILADTNELQADWTNTGRLDTILDAIVADTNELQTDDIPTLISNLNNVSTAQVNAEADQALSDFFTSSVQLVDDIWNEVLTAGTHNVATSSGRRLRNLESGNYQLGSIWIDTINGTAGTDIGENGTAENPVASLADAVTLSASTGLNRFQLAPGSSITLISSFVNYIFAGQGAIIALGNQTITGSIFIGLIVTGIGSDGTGKVVFDDCSIGTSILSCTLPPCHIHASDIVNTIIAQAAGDFFLDRCVSNVIGIDAPIFDFAAVGVVNLHIRNYSGGMQLENMDSADTASIEGWGQVIEGTCTGGTVVIRGHFTVSGITNLTLVDDARIDIGQINTEADTALTDFFTSSAQLIDNIWNELTSGHAVGGSFGVATIDILADTNELQTDDIPGLISAVQSDTDNIQTRLPTSLIDGRMNSDMESINDNTAAAVRLSRWLLAGKHGTASAGTASSITLVGGESSITDFYRGYLVALSAGTGQDQARLIIAYNGTTKVATVSPNWKTPPNNGTDYVLIPDGRVELLTTTQTSIDAIEADTNELQTDDIPTLIAALNDLSQAEVTGGAYAMNTDVNGSIRIVDGTGTGELDTNAGAIVQVDQLGTQAKADINAEIVDVMNVDTITLPGQVTPPSSPTRTQMQAHLYKSWLFKVDQSSALQRLYASDGSTVDQQRTVGEAGGIVTLGPITTGP